jgi:hypothetical protein
MSKALCAYSILLEDRAENVIETTYTKEILLSLGSLTIWLEELLEPQPIDPPRLLKKGSILKNSEQPPCQSK